MKDKFPQTLGAIALAVASTLAATGALAAAQQYRFTQIGFDGGGIPLGRFTADDYDHDGVVTLFHGEVLGFGLSFDGDSIVGSFALEMDDLQGLV